MWCSLPRGCFGGSTQWSKPSNQRTFNRSLSNLGNTAWGVDGRNDLAGVNWVFEDCGAYIHRAHTVGVHVSRQPNFIRKGDCAFTASGVQNPDGSRVFLWYRGGWLQCWQCSKLLSLPWSWRSLSQTHLLYLLPLSLELPGGGLKVQGSAAGGGVWGV